MHTTSVDSARGCSSLCCTKQLLLLPRNARNAQNLLAEKGLPRMVRMNTDCYGALFSHRIHRIHRIWQRGYGRDAIPSYICEHPCHLWESILCKRFCEFRVFCGNIFSPTDFTDLHRYLGCAVLPQNSQNSQNLVAWVWQGCHTLLHLCASVSSVGGSSLPEVSVRSVRSVGISFLPRMARIYTDA